MHTPLYRTATHTRRPNKDVEIPQRKQETSPKTLQIEQKTITKDSNFSITNRG